MRFQAENFINNFASAKTQKQMIHKFDVFLLSYKKGIHMAVQT